MGSIIDVVTSVHLAISADIDDDILLDQVAEKLGTKAYRVGILLGLSPAELDSLHFDYKDRGLVVLNTAMLVKWRNQGDRTTLELAQALMKVGMGRIAKELDPSGTSDLFCFTIYTYS